MRVVVKVNVCGFGSMYAVFGQCMRFWVHVCGGKKKKKQKWFVCGGREKNGLTWFICVGMCHQRGYMASVRSDVE